jgi:ATP-dependent RNA helicase RhlE
VNEAFLIANKPMAKPEGSGKKKRKNKASLNEDIWLDNF